MGEWVFETCLVCEEMRIDAIEPHPGHILCAALLSTSLGKFFPDGIVLGGIKTTQSQI